MNSVGQSAPCRKRRLSRNERRQRKRQLKQRKDPTSPEEHKSIKNPATTTASEDYRHTYTPTPIPEKILQTEEQKSLGKWFPKAVKLKRSLPSTDASCSILLFYQYNSSKFSDERVEELRQYLLEIGRQRTNLAGRIRIAPEGLNCTLSAIDSGESVHPAPAGSVIHLLASSESSAAATLRHFSYDLQQFDSVFHDTDYKYLDNLTADRHFAQLTIIPVKELVYYGLSEESAPLEKGGKHVTPQQFHRLLEGKELENDEKAAKETVVIDVRNHYEAAIGRFDGQSGAQYIDPHMRKSTDFPAWLERSQDELKGKRILMYCTGGIRCIRASAHLKQKLGDDAPEVYQLHGGIERYLEAFPDGGHWNGKNFTFDKREAVSAHNRNGDGGVVRKQETVVPGCVCVVCQTPWDRYVGKKKCSTCGVPILVCDTCMSSHKEKDARCPICVEQNVTVKVEDVEWTDNGTKPVGNGAVAPSVLKWGGGYAADKKLKRKIQRKPCRFGTECTRPDCFFTHPKGDGQASAEA